MIILIYHKKNGRSQILFMELLVKKENFPKIPSGHERVKVTLEILKRYLFLLRLFMRDTQMYIVK